MMYYGFPWSHGRLCSLKRWPLAFWNVGSRRWPKAPRWCERFGAGWGGGRLDGSFWGRENHPAEPHRWTAHCSWAALWPCGQAEVLDGMNHWRDAYGMGRGERNYHSYHGAHSFQKRSCGTPSLHQGTFLHHCVRNPFASCKHAVSGCAEAGTTEGGIFYDGASLGKIRSNVGYVTQDDIMYETCLLVGPT